MKNSRKIAFRLLLDSALLVGATTGARMLLVLSLIALGPYITGPEMAAYDMFVIISSYLMILLTLGMDSGLVITANARTAQRQTAYIWYALCLFTAITAISLLPAWVAFSNWFLGSLLNDNLFILAFIHAAIAGASLLIFSFYRWLGKATTAALFVIFGSILGVIAAFILFFVFGSIAAFITGLIIGSGIGLVICTLYLIRDRGLAAGSYQARYLRPLLIRMMKMSLPFMANSILLLSRRTVDRGLLLAIQGTALLGPFAYVSRLGEIVAFLFAIPASGMAPAFVRHHSEERYRRLARVIYIAYLLLALLVTSATFIIQLNWSDVLLPVDARPAAFVMTAMVAGNLFFGEVFIAGFGFVIKERGRAVAATTAFFIAVYILIAGTAAYCGFGLKGIATGFVIAAWLYAITYIHFAERLVSFAYPMLVVNIMRVATLSLALFSLWRFEILT
jgi:O-antigen/teichoic acid export membrane protein